MHSLPDIQEKRMDVLLRQEMAEHKHIISCHHKEMQELRDALSISKERFDALFEHTQNETKDLALYLNDQLLHLKDKVRCNQILIEEQRSVILDLAQQLHDLHTVYTSKKSSDDSRKDFESKLSDCVKHAIDSYQNHERSSGVLINLIKDEVVKLRVDLENGLRDLSDLIDRKFIECRLDKTGVLKEVRVWEKTIFIIEKKIENIYTLIERINKRGESCHKPV